MSNQVRDIFNCGYNHGGGVGVGGDLGGGDMRIERGWQGGSKVGDDGWQGGGRREEGGEGQGKGRGEGGTVRQSVAKALGLKILPPAIR